MDSPTASRVLGQAIAKEMSSSMSTVAWTLEDSDEILSLCDV